MIKPLVSVIIPLYNRVTLVEETVNSVLLQTYTNFELIIVDDCSVDNSFDLAKTYASQDLRIRVIKNDTNIIELIKPTDSLFDCEGCSS